MMNVNYGFGDTKTPMLIAIVNLIVNISLNLLLIRMIGINGLAIATSLSACIVFILRLILIEKYVQLDWKGIRVVFVELIAASFIACLCARILVDLFTINPYAELIIAAFTGVLVFLIELHILKINELKDVERLLSYLAKRQYGSNSF